MNHQKEFIQFICDYLRSNGWNIFYSPHVALSFKLYDSAVGKKEAQTYFSCDQYNWCLSGLYLSKGRNILETESVLIPKDCTAARLQELCELFLQNVETAIANSYAIRLL